MGHDRNAEKAQIQSFDSETISFGLLASRANRSLIVAVLAAILFILLASPILAVAQAEGSDWSHLAALPAGTHIHVAGDQMTRTCFLASVDDEKLLCSRKKNSSHSNFTFLRPAIRSIKLARYRRSTAVGLGVGLGIGLGAGAIAGQAVSPNTGSWLDFSRFGREFLTGVGGAGGLVAGGVIGGTTDFLHGSTVYRRQGPKP
jgi:hypothetical protein